MDKSCFKRFILLPIVLIALIPTCLALGPPEQSHPIRLRPIHIDDYEAAIGIHRRSSEEFSNLNLETQSELIHGSPGSTQ